MSWRARYSTPYNAVCFVETETGVFGAYVAPSKANQEVYTTGDTQRSVAIATTANYAASWSKYYNSEGGYPGGAFLEVRAYSSNANTVGTPLYTNAGPKVTVEDDHGTHVGTPTMSGAYVISYKDSVGAVAVMHESADDGWVFTGWRVTRKPQLSSSKMSYVSVVSEASGETDGLITFYPASALEDAALVIRIEKESNSSLDVLLVEAVYAESVTSCVLSFIKNAAGVTGAEIPAITVGVGSSVVLPTPELWEYDGCSFKEWNTAADGSGSAYTPGELYFPDGFSSAVSLYAIWAVSGGSGARYRNDPDDPDDGSWPRRTNVTYPYVVSVSIEGVLDDVAPVLVAETCAKMGQYYADKNLDTGKVSVYIEEAQGQTVALDYELPARVDVPETQYRTYTYQNRHSVSSGSQGRLTTQRYWAYPDRDWLWTAPEIEGLDFVGWFTIDKSYSSAQSSYKWSVAISSERVVTWGWLADRLNYTGDSDSYVNHLRLVYRGKRLMVTFQPNGGECGVFKINVYRGEAYGGLPVPSRPGHTFAGWYTARTGGELVTAGTVVTAMADHVLYAHWSKDPVTMTVHFVGCGGTVDPAEKTVKSGEAYGELPVPTRSGYTFLGWFTASLGGERVTSSTIVGRTFSHWLYAQWESPEPDPPEEPEEPDQPEENPLILERYPAWNLKT